MKIKQSNTQLSDKTSGNYIDSPPPLTTEECIALTDVITALRALVDDVLDQGYTISGGKLIPPPMASQAKSNS